MQSSQTGPVTAEELRTLLEELTTAYDVPGATLAVLSPEGLLTTATGVTNLGTGVPVTPDTLFQMGSITKLYTTSAVCRLVERGLLDLDEPVRRHLPDLRLGDEDAARRVTLRHLLTHTSGIDGDHFLDTGRGDDALAAYVASCADLPQQFPVGSSHSYCNAGFSIAGRVLEVVTGRVWDTVVREEVLAPLGLDRTWSLPEDVLRFSAACGHLGAPGSLSVTPQWGMPRSLGPSGLLNATASDVVAFARAFLDGGRAPDGTVWLREQTVRDMLAPLVDVPDPHTLGPHWALGWIVHHQQDGRRVLGHDGSTLGQGAVLRVVPDRGVAISLMANGGGISDLARPLVRRLLPRVADVELPAALEPVAGADGGDRSAQVGRYERAAVTEVVAPRGDGGLTVTLTNTSALASVVAPDQVVIELHPVAPDLYVGRPPGAHAWASFVFYDGPDGRRFLHHGARAIARVED